MGPTRNRRSYFTLREAKYTSALATKLAGHEARLYAGLDQLTTLLLGWEWSVEGGATFCASSGVSLTPTGAYPRTASSGSADSRLTVRCDAGARQIHRFGVWNDHRSEAQAG